METRANKSTPFRALFFSLLHAFFTRNVLQATDETSISAIIKERAKLRKGVSVPSQLINSEMKLNRSRFAFRNVKGNRNV